FNKLAGAVMSLFNYISRRTNVLIERPGGSAAVSPRTIEKVVLSSVLGTAVEWYDFLVYGLASALGFNKLFFPSLSPAIGTIAAFGSYGVGFFARPLGGMIF